MKILIYLYIILRYYVSKDISCLLSCDISLMRKDAPLPTSTLVDGWVTCDFTSFSIVFQSYQDDERLIMKGCVQWNPVYG